VLQQRLGALQAEVEHLKDDLDATVGHIHAAAQQSLQFLSFNKALQVGGGCCGWRAVQSMKQGRSNTQHRRMEQHMAAHVKPMAQGSYHVQYVVL
jgi:hypothetical protein